MAIGFIIFSGEVKIRVASSWLMYLFQRDETCMGWVQRATDFEGGSCSAD